MTGTRGFRARVTVLCVLACAATAVLAWAAAAPADAALARCSISGAVQGNNPAHVGDPIYAVANVTGHRCDATEIRFQGGGRVLDDQFMVSGQTSYSTIFNAFAGLTTVTAVLNTGETGILGAVNVVGATTTPPPPPHSSPLPPPVTVTVGSTGSSTSSRSASKSATPTKARTSIATVPQIRVPDYGGDDLSTDPTDTPTPSSSASPSDSAVAFPVDVIHGSGSVDPIPSGLVLAAIVVLGGVLGVAVRFVYLYTRSPEHLA